MGAPTTPYYHNIKIMNRSKPNGTDWNRIRFYKEVGFFVYLNEMIWIKFRYWIALPGTARNQAVFWGIFVEWNKRYVNAYLSQTVSHEF